MFCQRRASALCLALAISVAWATGVFGQTSSPLAGTWKLNLAKSTFSPTNLAPKSGTTKYEITGDQIKTVTDGVDSQGRVTHSESTARFDGKDYSYKGTIAGQLNPNQDAVVWKKIDDFTYETVNKLRGQLLTTQRTVVAKDGKSRTNTITGKNAQGQTVNNTTVYEKQ